MMDKTSEDSLVGVGAEIEKSETSKPAGCNAPQRDDSASVGEDTFDDLADLGVQPQHRWRKDARHSASGGTVGIDMPGRSSPTRFSDSAGPHKGRLSMPTTNKELIQATYDAEIIEAISSDVEDSDYYTSGSEDEYSDSDTDAVAYPSDSDAVASESVEENSAAITEGTASITTETERKKAKKDKKKKKKDKKDKKDKKKKRSSKKSSASARASRSIDGSVRSTRTSDAKKKRKSSRTSHSSTATTKTVEEQAAENEAQKEQILKLQNQLSEALHKVVTTTEEHINDKNNFLKVSTESTELKGQITVLTKARDDALETVQAKEIIITEQGTRIGKLEEAVERQLDLQEELETKVDRSEEEINKLLEEIEELEKQQLQAASGDGEGASSRVAATSRALQAELDQCKSKLEEKEKQLEEYKATIAELEKELEEGRTINRLQVSEMEETNISLQGKLKAEKLEVARKLEQKDETIAELQKQIDTYKRTDDVQDLVAAREKLNETMLELDETRAAKELAMEDFATVNGEKEDLLEKLDVITTQAATLRQENKELEAKANKSHLQVLEWTEKTYDWKSRAEAAEKKLQSQDGAEDPFDDPAKQGLFLQAIMDNQAAKQQRASTGANLRRSVQGWFSKVDSHDEADSDASVEQIRIRKLEERNASLDATVSQLRSEMVKLQSSHKDTLYSLQKELEALRGENEALKLKNSTLEQQSS